MPIIRIFEEARWDLVQERGFGFQNSTKRRLEPGLSLKGNEERSHRSRKIKVVTR